MALDVLIVDDDPWILDLVSKVVRRRGHTPHLARDGEEGLKLAESLTPHLVITDVIMPRLDGWGLVRSLRAHSRLALVPVIFLTSLGTEDDRVYGFRLGADDYLAKPFRFEELDLRITNVLRRQSDLAAAREQGGQGLSGRLDDFGVSTLLNLIDLEQKSGTLELRGPGGAVAELTARRGRIVAAHIAGSPEVGADAIYRLLTWRRGQFCLRLGEVDAADTIGLNTGHLLLEGARRIDELGGG